MLTLLVAPLMLLLLIAANWLADSGTGISEGDISAVMAVVKGVTLATALALLLGTKAKWVTSVSPMVAVACNWNGATAPLRSLKL